jgi:predicted Zn finger-like uncharacterized protein
MIIQCPKCQTTYKVADEVLKGAAPAFRCSRCKHTFELESQDLREKAPRKTPPQSRPLAHTAEEREPKFAFTPKVEKKTASREASPVDVPIQDHQAAAATRDPSDQWALSGYEPQHEEPFTISETSGPKKEEKIFDVPKDPPTVAPPVQPISPHQESTDKILALDPFRDQQTSTIPYLTLFGLLVIFFALVTAFNQAHPKATEGIVRQIPLVGASVLKNNHLKNGVMLQQLRASYQSIQGNREVFVISGVASNQNPVTIREVRVAGQIFNSEGKELEQQTIWVGNAISPKLVRGMSTQDISDLQRLKPLKSFDIPPGDSVPFAIVFLKPSKGVKDFTCEVVAADGVV